MRDELYDDDGYPTEAALEELEFFVGTPKSMTEYIADLMRNGSAKVEDVTDQFGRLRKRLTLITCGWSGCESVISTLHRTLFHFAYWESSFRGGLYTYEVPEKIWTDEAEWGNLGGAAE